MIFQCKVGVVLKSDHAGTPGRSAKNREVATSCRRSGISTTPGGFNVTTICVVECL